MGKRPAEYNAGFQNVESEILGLFAHLRGRRQSLMVSPAIGRIIKDQKHGRRRSRGNSWHQRVKQLFGRSRENSNDFLGVPELVLSASISSEKNSRLHSPCTGSRKQTRLNSMCESDTEDRRTHGQASKCLNCRKYFHLRLSKFAEFCSLDCKSAHRLRTHGGLVSECYSETSTAPQPYYYIC